MVKEMLEVNVASILAFVLLVASSANVLSKIDNGCILPKYPMQGRWAINNDTKLGPKETVQNGISITVACNNQHKLNGSSLLICNNGTWSEEIGQCLDLCPPIFETYSTRITCTTNGQSSNCTTPTNSTIATIECAPFYENRELNNMTSTIICENGRWNKEIRFCSAVCGLEPTEEGLYPWNVLIYQNNFIKLGPSCAGTLVNDKTILTAASCVSDATDTTFSRSEINLFDMKIAAGKSWEKYENPDPDPDVQYRSVQDVFVPDTYKGFSTKLYSDIAVIIVKIPFKITRRVYPACVDLLEISKKKSFFDGELKVPGPLNSLKSSNNIKIYLRVLDESNCIVFLESIRDEDGLSNYNNHFTTIDKYCVKNITTSYNAVDCSNRIYQGLGIISVKFISNTTKYYVIGVTSLGSAHNDCYNNAFTLITTVSHYTSFISKIFNLYSTTGPYPIQTSCGIKRARTLIFDDSTVTKVDYPWHVAIYDKYSTGSDLHCQGSLVSPRIILTAAACVAYSTQKENYIVAVGKYFQNLDDPRDKNYSQFSGLKEIIVSTEFTSGWTDHFSDIAILISEISFDISGDIKPICLDWQSKYEDQFLTPNSTGFVAGWGFIHRNQSFPNKLTDLEIRLIDKQQCRNANILAARSPMSDKLCFGYLDKENNVGLEKSGNGLIFKNTHDSRYYLVGIACEKEICAAKEHVFYTQVSKYIISFILKNTRLYWS